MRLPHFFTSGSGVRIDQVLNEPYANTLVHFECHPIRTADASWHTTIEVSGGRLAIYAKHHVVS
jgi:hypothetical protein